MAKKVLLRDWNNDEVLPITRGELVLDSSGKEAFRSNEFLATTSQPGLMSSEDKFKIDNIEGIGNIANDKVSQVNTTTSDVYRLLFSETADDETRTEGARKSAKLTFNPSTGVLQTSGLIGNLDGTYVNKLTGYSKATLISDITSEDTLISALGKVELRAEVAYNLIQGAYDGDGTIENLAEILKVLEGISDTETIQAIVGKYLPLTGGIIKGVSVNPLKIDSDGIQTYIDIRNNGSTKSAVGYHKDFGVFLYNAATTDYLGIKEDGTPYYYDSAYYTLIHSGNIGNYAVKYDGGASIDKARHSIGYDNRSHGSVDIPMSGGYISFGHDSYGGQLFGHPNGEVLLYRGISNNVLSAWKNIAFLDSDITGNAASATKLQDNTAYTAWGAIYFNNGKPQNVDNSLYIGTNYGLFLNKDLEGIYLVGTGINWHNTSNTWTKSIMRFNSSGNVTIGASDLASTNYKLYVDSNAYFNSYVALANNSGIYFKDTNGTIRSQLYVDPNNDTSISYGSVQVGGNSYIFGTNIFFSTDTNKTRAVSILNNGNVLIGATTDNGSKLQVAGSVSIGSAISLRDSSLSAARLVIEEVSANINYIHLYTDTNNTTTNRPFVLQNGFGNVLIGTATDNGAKLQVNGNISSTNLWPIITISKSLTITSDWTDTGITFNATNFPHGNGSYMVQIDHGNCYFYTGVISVVINDGAVTANDVDEIILHGGGFDSAVQYYLRTKQDASSKTTKIQIATSGSSHTKTVNFKFKRII